MECCDICNGTGQITLPRHFKIPVDNANLLKIDIEYTKKTFPCPECSAWKSLEDKVIRYTVVKTVPLDSLYIEDQEAIYNVIKYDMLRNIAESLYKDNKISFSKKEKTYCGQNMLELTASINIVSDHVMDTVEQRIEKEANNKIIKMTEDLLNRFSWYASEMLSKQTIYSNINKSRASALKDK